jgi:LysM repeat protein
MKNSVLLSLCLTAHFFAFGQYQEKIYLDYDNNDCMSRYEYRLSNSLLGGGYIVYHVFKNKTERMALEVGTENINHAVKKPTGTISCGTIRVTEDIVRRINAGLTEVYVVRAENGGYNVSKVSMASFSRVADNKITHFGPDFGLNYTLGSFAGTENLGMDSNKPSVYFQGEDDSKCQAEYAFRKIPMETCKPYTNFSYIPNIGVVQEATGLNDEQTTRNTMTLTRINNHPLDTYLAAQCQGESLADASILKQKATVAPPGAVVESTPPASQPIASAPATEYDLISKGTPVETPATAPKKEPVEAPVKKIVCNKSASPGVHIVQQEETLYGISRKNGITLDQLRAWNSIPADQTLIKPCTALYTTAPTTYEKGATETKRINTKPVILKDATELAKATVKKTTKATIAKTPTTKSATTLSATTHTVAKGESLGAIACKYGYTLDKLMEMNELTSDKIYVGQELIVSDKCNCPVTATAIEKPSTAANDLISRGGILSEYEKVVKAAPTTDAAPPAAAYENLSANGRFHTVKQGENLYSISRAYGTTVEKIQQLNGLDDPTKLDLNQVLRVE